jgi:hypothetical protein
MDSTHAAIRIEARIVGKRKPMETPWDVVLPPALLQEAIGAADTTSLFLLRHLIEYIVREEVRAFRIRQQERRLIHVLSPQQILDASREGKITMGGEQGQIRDEIDEDAAVQVALQGFVDGIYFVFLDGQQQHDLDAPVQLHSSSTLLFIRLVPLVGG